MFITKYEFEERLKKELKKSREELHSAFLDGYRSLVLEYATKLVNDYIAEIQEKSRKIVEDRVGTEEFLDEIIKRIRDKQL